MWECFSVDHHRLVFQWKPLTCISKNKKSEEIWSVRKNTPVRIWELIIRKYRVGADVVQFVFDIVLILTRKRKQHLLMSVVHFEVTECESLTRVITVHVLTWPFISYENRAFTDHSFNFFAFFFYQNRLDKHIGIDKFKTNYTNSMGQNDFKIRKFMTKQENEFDSVFLAYICHYINFFH